MRREIFLQALKSVKGNRLRSIITISIIAVGITALVGALTATAAVRSTISAGFGKLGAGSFIIRSSREQGVRTISYHDARCFQEQYGCKAAVAPYVRVDLGLNGVSSGRRETTPDVEMIGSTSSFVEFNGGNIVKGRNFSPYEEASGRGVCILGANVAKMLMVADGGDSEMVSVRGHRFKVVGLLGEMGSGAGSLDNVALIPAESARMGLLSGDEPFAIGILPRGEMDLAVDEAVTVMRGVRRLQAGEGDDFLVRRRDSALAQMEKMMGMVTLAAFMIGFITLLGAAVGLMNIMLVSVKDRTAEIGVRKALGASDEAIGRLFLMEAIVIGELGGLLGVFFGLVAGGVVAAVMDVKFIVPWGWIVVSLIVCMSVSLLSGALPARRAAKLAPIEALREQ